VPTFIDGVELDPDTLPSGVTILDPHTETDMPTIQGRTNLAAGIKNNNVLAGSAYEFAPYHSRVDIAVVGDAVQLPQATVQVGSDVLLEESEISRQARVPVWPDDYTLSDVAAKGDRLKIAVRNPGAGAVDVFWALRLTPIV